MALEIYLAYLVTVGVFFASPPGPSQLLMISNSMRHGLVPSLATASGDLSANALQMTAAAFGLAALLSTSATALEIVKWAGVAYLVYVGVRTFRSVPGGTSGVGSAPRGRLFRQGFLTSASNPTAVFFFAALFPQFIDSNQPIWPQLLILGSTYIVIDGAILLLFGALAEKLVSRLRAGFHSRLNKISGGLMIAAAILLGFKDVEVEASR